MSDESVSEVEVNKPVTSEDASFLSKSYQKPTRAWLKPLFLGAGLGIAIAFGGMGVLSRLPSRQPSAVADKKVNPAMTVTIATVETAARVQQLQTQLGQTVVRSPVAGVIAEKLARVGDVTGVPPQTQVGTVIGGTQKLFSIIQDEKLELQAKVPEIQLNQVKIGASVQITSDVDQRVRSQGRVREIQPQVNDQRREATVKIDLPPTSLLKPGMFASAAITTNSGMKIVVPQKAVQSQADSSVIVFTLSSGDIVRSQKVELGDPANGDKVEIKSGLQLGDRVVVDGAGYLKDGDKVRVAS
ncbi:efflux RND transporter periplasmic adaptor subunit [Nostoc sp. HG1]|nr:efflux RND transporter periplasmic adaptor subunit [Nostoc sp. HG1]